MSKKKKLGIASTEINALELKDYAINVLIIKEKEPGNAVIMKCPIKDLDYAINAIGKNIHNNDMIFNILSYKNRVLLYTILQLKFLFQFN